MQDEAGAIPEDVGTALLLGHNPGWEEALAVLIEERHALTTGNAALLEIEAPSWQDAIERAGEWMLHGIVRPKEL